MAHQASAKVVHSLRAGREASETGVACFSGSNQATEWNQATPEKHVGINAHSGHREASGPCKIHYADML